jgi:hypothetical protein
MPVHRGVRLQFAVRLRVLGASPLLGSVAMHAAGAAGAVASVQECAPGCQVSGCSAAQGCVAAARLCGPSAGTAAVACVRMCMCAYGCQVSGVAGVSATEGVPPLLGCVALLPALLVLPLAPAFRSVPSVGLRVKGLGSRV